uniref:N-acetyltransferase ESCO2 n=1 Tax=Cacopsylla melanoneura TaxID=428564 RepID=A0A8D9EPE1_9HEMI
MTEALGEFGGFKSSSFYGKPLTGNIFSSLIFHTPTIGQTQQSPTPKRSRSFSVDSKKAKKAKTSLFSGVKHGLKKPKPKKVEVKKYINTDTDKVLKSNKKKKENELSTKENKPLNQTLKTPVKEVKSASKRKSSNKKGNGNVEVENESFRYRFQVTPDHMKVPKVLPYLGFDQSAESSNSSNKKGKKKLFNHDESDDDMNESLKSSSKKIKLSNNKPSPLKTNKSPKKLFASENKIQVTTPKHSIDSPRSPSTRSASKKVNYETIHLTDTPSPHNTPIFSKVQDSVSKSNPNSTRKSTRLSAVVMNSPQSNKTKTKTPTKINDCIAEPMLVDSPRSVGSPSTKKTSTPCSTPMITRSSVKKFSLDQDSPKRTLSSKKKLFPKENYNTTPGEYFEKDVTADSFNVFDILNDSLDGIEMLDGSCNEIIRQNLFSPKNTSYPNGDQMNVSHVWESSPEMTTTNQSAHYTFPKCKDTEPHSHVQTVNTFPRSTRASRKCVRQLTPNPRMYGSCKKTLKTAFDLSQLQLSSPSAKICPVCAYEGDSEDTDHIQIHSVVLKLKHYDYKNETVVSKFHADKDRIVKVTLNDVTWLPKAKLVIEIADNELGFAESECSVLEHTQVYLYITKQTIVGLVVANPLTQANRLLSSTMNHSVDYASEEAYQAECGISRIWVLKTYRRRHIATRLLDAVRENFCPHKTVSKQKLAFSVPTSDGKFLAAKYIERKDFLIFTDLK